MNPDERDRHSIDHDLRSDDEEVRRLAVERLVLLPTAESVPRLVECLGDASWRVRKAAVERLVAQADAPEVICALIDSLADGDNPGRRNSAVEALVRCGPRSVPPLLDALDHPDVDVRKFVVDCLAGIGDASSRRRVIDALRDADANIRGAAADALGVIGGEGVPEALLSAVRRTDEEPLVRFSALRALARLEAEVRVEDLGPALDDPILRSAAFEVLGRADGEPELACLLKGLAAGSRATREAAMQALLRLLGNVDDARADAIAEGVREAAAAQPELVPEAVAHLAESDLATRLVLIQFLSLLRVGEAVVPVLRAGRDEAVAEIAHAALEALGEVAEDALDAEWPGLDPDLRRDACAVLGRTRGQRGTQRLLAALDDPDGELRAVAARSLGARGCAEALPTLVRRLEATALEDEFEAQEELDALSEALVAMASGPETDVTERAIELLAARVEGAAEEVRRAVANVLGRIGRPRDAELVALLLKDPSACVRRAAVQALSRLEHGVASEPLRLALADEAPEVRIAAAAALGAAPSGDVLDDLQRLTADDDASVRAAALRAIGAHAAARDDGSVRDAAVVLLEQGLRDEGGAAMAAVEGLRALGTSEAARAAVTVLERPEPELVQTAIACIGAHGDPPSVEAVLPLVMHPNWAVRAEAIQTLAERRVAKAVPPILRRLEVEQDAFVRDAILRALQRLEG